MRILVSQADIVQVFDKRCECRFGDAVLDGGAVEGGAVDLEGLEDDVVVGAAVGEGVPGEGVGDVPLEGGLGVAGGGEGEVAAEEFAGAAGHLGGDFGGDGVDVFRGVAVHAEVADFLVEGVGGEAAEEEVGGAGDGADFGLEAAAGEAFGDGEGEAGRAQEEFLEGALGWGGGGVDLRGAGVRRAWS